MSERIIAEIKDQKYFYRNNFRLIVKLLFYMMFGIIILLGVILFEYFNLPDPEYYSTSNDGTLSMLKPVARGTGLIDPPDQRDVKITNTEE